MLEIRRTAVALDEEELLELEPVITDRDEKGGTRLPEKGSL